MTVTGWCDTSRCKAVCCRAQHFRPDRQPPCEYLMDDYRCELHVVGGINCKPMGCALYPRNQYDIDCINADAERLGLKERCHLVVIED